MVQAEGAPSPNHGDFKDLKSRSVPMWGWNEDTKVKVTWMCYGYLSHCNIRDKLLKPLSKTLEKPLRYRW